MKKLEGLVLPTCEILVNGQLRKLYGKKKNKVYLNNGDNFQLKFFNPLQERIGVQLRMNGQKVDDDLMVINPGQDITIERFIGTNRKLKFSTYEIDASNKEAVKAIERNGLLEVIFWNEKINPEPVKPIIIADNNSIIYSGSSLKIESRDVVINGNLIINGELKVTGHSGTCGSSGIGGTSGASGKSGSVGDKIIQYKKPGLFINDVDQSYVTSNSNGMGNIMSPSASADYSQYLAESTDKSINYNDYMKLSSIDYTPQGLSRGIVDVSKKLETGRIEKGDYSNQHFKPIQFEIGEAFYKIKFKLLPFSLKKVKKNSMIPQL